MGEVLFGHGRSKRGSAGVQGGMKPCSLVEPRAFVFDLDCSFLPPLEYAKKRLNEVGARIGDALDNVTHTVHDPRKMRLAAGFRKIPDEAFDAWWKFTKPKLADKTCVSFGSRPCYFSSPSSPSINQS